MPGPSALVDMDYLVARMAGSVISQYSVLAALDELGVISLQDLLPILQERLDLMSEEAATQAVPGNHYTTHEPLVMLIDVIKGAIKPGAANSAPQGRPVTAGSVPAAGGES